MCDCSIYLGLRVQVWSIIWGVISQQSLIFWDYFFPAPAGLSRSLSRTSQQRRCPRGNQGSGGVPVRSPGRAAARGQPSASCSHSGLPSSPASRPPSLGAPPQGSLASPQSLNLLSPKASTDLAPSGGAPEPSIPAWPSS